MRRRRLAQLQLDLYIYMTAQEKEEHQERVFTYYYDRNNMDIESAIEELETDLMVLEEQEQYERCALLRDVLDRVRN